MTAAPAVLDVLRASTAAFIADDPTIVVLTPYGRTKTATGGFIDAPGTPRIPQIVKLVLLSSDQRPTVTVAGVDRQADYHLVGPHDMAIAVGDRWIDQGTEWEILGFTEGWDYMTKAFVGRYIPRGTRP